MRSIKARIVIMSDISGIIKSTGVALEAQALKTFGAAVENATRGMLGKVFSTPGKAAPSSSNPTASDLKDYIPGSSIMSDPGVFDPTKYSASIASGQGGLNPKGKFLFKVGFRVIPEVATLLSNAGYATNLLDSVRDLTFLVMNIDLPSVTYDYEEVNMYNFRTKVLKRIEFKDLSFSFHDDVGNTGLNFINTYMMAFSPITRRQQKSNSDILDSSGFAFSDKLGSLDTSLRAALPGNYNNIISEIFIEHFYVEVSNVGSPVDAVKLNTFFFTNPRLNEFAFGSLDYSSSDLNELRMSINFDSIYIEPGSLATQRQTPSLPKNDIMDGTDILAPAITRGATAQAGKASNPFIDILSRQGQRLAQTTVSNALGKVFGNTSAGRALSGAIGSVSGALGQAAGRTIGNVATSVSEKISVTKLPLVNDNSAASGSVSQQSSRDEDLNRS